MFIVNIRTRCLAACNSELQFVIKLTLRFVNLFSSCRIVCKFCFHLLCGAMILFVVRSGSVMVNTRPVCHTGGGSH